MMAWYVAVAKNGRTMKAKGELDAKGFESFLPIERLYGRRSGFRYLIEKPLLGRYFFVEAADNDDLHHIRKTMDVERILSSETGPLSVDVALIDALRQAETAGSFDKTSKDRSFGSGERVRITAGPFKDMIGALAKNRGHKRWEVIVRLFGGEGPAVTEERNMELICDEKAA